MKPKTKADPDLKSLVELATQEAGKSTTWADFANYLYNPYNGLITKPFPTSTDRRRFMKTKEYKQILEMLHELQDKTGFVEGAAPTRSRFVIDVPRSLQSSLMEEAVLEGVSLDQLVVAKLSTRLAEAIQKAPPKRARTAV